MRLCKHLRGLNDETWNAQFLVDGRWSPNKPVSLSTRDWDEACENARDKSVILETGIPLRQERVDRSFRKYAEPVIAALREQAIEADQIAAGKGHNFRDLARRIECDLVPRWGATDIAAINEHMLNNWIADDYRVEDVAATAAKYGRQQRGAGRQVVHKRPSMTTLGNLDRAFLVVWEQAAADGVVERRSRPMIDKVKYGEDGEPRAFIDAEGVKGVAKVMSDEWTVMPNGHSTRMKRMLRAYIAMLASTGIRAGLEAKRVRLGDVQFVKQATRPVIYIRVQRNQGKRLKPRSVVVFEGGVFRVRHLLAEQISWRRGQGAKDTDYLFAWPDGSFPTFRDCLNDVLTEADALLDPMTGEKRVAYSFRHFFATLLIERGLPVPHIAGWLGTSSAMIERHYNRFLIERDAHRFNGAPEEPKFHVDGDGMPWHWDEAEGEDGEWVPG